MNRKVKTLLVVYCIVGILVLSCKDNPAIITLDAAPSFSAIVVDDLAASVVWYEDVFGLTVSNQINQTGANVTILSGNEFELELLELSGSVNRAETLDAHPQGTQIQGLFKIGFKVENLHAWLTHLETLQIPVPQVYTDPATGKRNFIIADPDGNNIQFFE